jgi:DNA polymerase-4
MEVDPGLKWLFLDLNSYFASVEQQDRKELRGRPVAVVPMETDHTCCIAASYEAKAYGIKTGTNVGEAKRLCPSLRCVLARHDIYRRYHDKVLDETINHVPINKVWSIDEFASRLPERLRGREAAIDAAQRLKDGIRRNVGEVIRCSIGLAPNSFLAKVATDMEKPDGLVVLEGKDLPGRLFDLKLTDLPGINVRMEARLRAGGVRTIEDLWTISPKHARKLWGGVGGERFWYNLHGYDVPDQKTNTGMVGHSRMLDSNLRGPEQAREVARRLTIKAATRLRRYEFYATSFHLGVRTVDDRRWAMEAKLPPVQDNYAFLHALDELWGMMLPALFHYSPPSCLREGGSRGEGAGRREETLRFKKVSVTMHGLCRREEITPDLFDSQSEAYAEVQKRHETLTHLMDFINKKHGAEKIHLGVSPKTSAGFLGTKIAFSRVPDMEEFAE